MRRQLLFTGILLCALTLGGWGGVAAKALCPHAAEATVDAAATAIEATAMDGDHTCCPAKDDMADEHCSGDATSETEATPQTNNDERSLAQLAESCLHCVSHNSLPVSQFSMRELQPKGSEVSPPVPSREVKPLAPPAERFSSVIIPVQGAPPGPPDRKHLLLSVFLI